MFNFHTTTVQIFIMSKPTITNQTDKSVTIEFTVHLDPSSMLKSEDAILDALNGAGRLAAEVALEQFDTDGSDVVLGQTKLTSKGKYNKTYETQWGKVDVERHVYQSSKGGKQYCPLEQSARIIQTASPRFAKIVSWKYAEKGSTRVQEDLMQSHGIEIARSHLKSLGDTVGSIVQAKEEHWEYAVPKQDKPISSIAVGLDGTCMLLAEDGWREAMVGTLSLYDRQGDRQHTIQIGATPEYGKERFLARLDQELTRIKSRYPKATYVGIADGASENWKFLKQRTDRQTLDFFHASGYLGKAATILFPKKAQSDLKSTWLDTACHKLKHVKGAASRLLTEMRTYLSDHPKLKLADKETLQSSVTYFENHKEKMKYANNLNENLPIGSGVTESACKTLVKQRLCNSGMRWKDAGAQAVLSLRALTHTDTRWNQFWDKLDQYGYNLAA